MYQLKNYKPSCISQQAESACLCPAPKWALHGKEMSYPIFSCPDGINLPKQGGPAQSIPPLQALRWYSAVGEGGRGKPPRIIWRPGLWWEHSSDSPMFQPSLRMEPWFWCAKELSEFCCLVTVERKNALERKMKETVITGSYVYVHINDQAHRMNL